jgi:F-type H+-transporting ATPase subunit b
MKTANKIIAACLYILAGVACIHILGSDVLAAEESSGGRKTWDEVMLWLNAAILFGVMIKFGGPPIMGFLRGQRQDVAREIKQVEEEKEKITAKIQETFKTLDESEARFADMKQRIINQGEKRKQEIIEEAIRQSQLMMDTAKRKLESQILQAKSTFKSEMVDVAVDLASEKLPKQITDADNQRFVDDYLSKAVKS